MGKEFNKKFLTAVCQWLSGLLLMVSANVSHAAQDILSAEERAWLVQHPEIRVALNYDGMPLSFLNKNKQQAGLVDDYFDIIEQKLHTKFTYVAQPSAQNLADITEEDADVVAAIADDGEFNSHWWLSKPYLNYPLYLIARNNTPADLTLKKMGDRHVTVVNGSPAHEFLRAYYPNVAMELANDACDGMRHVAFDEEDAILIDLPAASWCLRDKGLLNLKAFEKTEFEHKISIGVRKDWPMLQNILEKALASISSAERAQIYQRWYGYNVFEKSWLHQYQVWLAAVCLLLLGGGIVRLCIANTDAQAHMLADLSANTEFAAPTQSQGTVGRKKIINPLLALFVAFIAITLYAIIMDYRWNTQNDRDLLIIILGIVVTLTLTGGYILGGLRRAKQTDALFSSLLTQFSLRKKSEQLQQQQHQSLLRQNGALLAIADLQLIDWHDSQQFFQKITELAAEAMQVDRVSIWLMSADERIFKCESFYRRSLNQHASGELLNRQDWAEYFQALESTPLLAIDDATSASDKRMFMDGYLASNNIGALLDAGVWANKKMLGFVCFEHSEGPRNWTLYERNFVRSIADIIQLSVEIAYRKMAENALIQHQNALESTIKQRTAALQYSSQLSQFLFERAPVAIAYMNIDNEILAINDEAEKLSGYRREAMLGKTFHQLFSGADNLSQHQALAAQVASGSKLEGTPALIRRADNSVVQVALWRSKETNVDGKPFIITIAQDITQQKALETELILAREAAESADRLKSMVIASISHELRTPLNSIIGFLGVALQSTLGDLTSQQREPLSRAYQSSKHLLALISDVIDISKIEAGFLKTHIEKFELKPLLLEARQVVSHSADEKKLALGIECADHIGLETDKKRLLQVVLNVLSNAVKYTEKGQVTLKAKVLKGQLIISVQDTGIGIAEAGLANIFKPFERADSRLKMKTSGTGLGLYLSQKILAQLLGGTIEVKSKLEVGSTFTIKMPLKMPKSKSGQTASMLEAA